MSDAAKVLMLVILRDEAYKNPNLKLRLAALKLYRDEIDKIPYNMFRHDQLDADIAKLEEIVK